MGSFAIGVPAATNVVSTDLDTRMTFGRVAPRVRWIFVFISQKHRNVEESDLTVVVKSSVKAVAEIFLLAVTAHIW
jgi:hypothetical protein